MSGEVSFLSGEGMKGNEVNDELIYFFFHFRGCKLYRELFICSSKKRFFDRCEVIGYYGIDDW